MAVQVVRVWKGYGTAEGVSAYCSQHFAQVVWPQLEALDGFLGATVMMRPVDDAHEVVVATRWESIEAVKGFAGDEYDRAVVEPEVRALLQRFEDRVDHYTVVLRHEVQA